MIDWGWGTVVYQVHPEGEPGKSELWVVNSRTAEQQNVVKTRLSGKWYSEQEVLETARIAEHYKKCFEELQAGLVVVAEHNARALDEVKNGA